MVVMLHIRKHITFIHIRKSFHYIQIKSSLNYKIALFENTTRILIDWDNLSIPVKKCIRENLLTIKHLDLSIMGRMLLNLNLI